MDAAICPVCGNPTNAVHARSKDIEYFTSEDVYSLMRCGACEVLFVNPMLADRLDSIYPPNYYAFVDGKKGWTVAVKEWLDRRAFRQISASLKGESLSVLDIGGGTGWLAGQLKACDPRFRRSTIVDIDGAAANKARAAGHEFFLGRFEDFPEDGLPYNLILMLNLIEHVPDPEAVLRKASALLAPGGVIWVKTPNFDALDQRIFRHRSWGGFHTPRHFVLFNRMSFERVAAKVGLVAASFAYSQGAPFWTVSILDTFRRWGIVSVTAERPSIYHPLTPYLQALMAAVDFARIPLGGKPSQMVFLLKKRD